MLWNVIENNCPTETFNELEGSLAASQGEGGDRMVQRRGGEDSGWVRAEREKGLIGQRKGK